MRDTTTTTWTIHLLVLSLAPQDEAMEAETLAGLFGLGGALVGAAVSTGAIVWQQRKAAHEAERTYLLGLAEGAAKECIRLSYEMQEHFSQGVGDERSPEGQRWHEELQRMNRALEEQSLRFSDPQVRKLLSRCHAEILIRPDWVGGSDDDPWSLRYITICGDIRTVMGAVIRRQPFPMQVWQNYPDLP